jgi:hypothetical protein
MMTTLGRAKYRIRAAIWHKSPNGSINATKRTVDLFFREHLPGFPAKS